MTPEINIFYGPEIWSLQHAGGISRYFSELIPRIKTGDNRVYAFSTPNQNVFLERIPRELLIQVSTFDSSSLLEFNKLEKLESTSRSIYHSTYYGKVNYSHLKKNGYKIITTVHDLISEKIPNEKKSFIPRVNLKKKAIVNADHIICISNSTKNDLENIYKIDSKKISVVHLGVKTVEKSSRIRSDKPIIEKFLLFVGKRDGYKNFLTLLIAFGESKFLKENFKLVLFGGENFSDKEMDLIEKYDLLDRIYVPKNDDETLENLYLTATALVYPSLYEGFGLPVIEAMSFGCPVFAGNTSSIPEIGGDAVFYFDPHTWEEVKFVLEKTLTSADLLSSKSIIGYSRAAQFSWDKTATQTLKVYNHLLND
jgi:glycosyltransferase involved in cell wall biosynthesis